MIKIIKENYSHYQSFMAAPKYVTSPISVEDTKVNHPQSYYYVGDLVFSNPVINNARLTIEISKDSVDKFSACIMTDDLDSKQLFRYDTKGGAHINGFDTSKPLSERKISIPHFHHYDENGNMIAFKTKELMDNTNRWRSIDYGLPLFFEKAHIYDKNTGQIPSVKLIHRES